MNILIITHFYPPLNEIASLRTFNFAKYWSKDNKIFVITTRKYSYDGYIDLNLTLPNVEISEVEYTPLFFWLNKSDKKTQTSNYKRNKKGWLKKLASSFYLRSSALLDQQYFWIPKAIKKGKEIISENNIDVVYSSYGPSSAHIVASCLKKKFPQITWAADYRDLWSQNHMIKKFAAIKEVEKWIEKKTLKNKADIVTTVSLPLKEVQEKFLGVEVNIIENGFEAEEYQLRITAKNIRKDKIRIIHTGTIYEGFRDPTPLFIALNELHKEGKIQPGNVVVEFYGNRLGNLGEIIESNKAEIWAKIEGYRNREDILEIQKNADLLLLLESNKEESKGVLTGKLFEYLFTGVPILSIGLDKLAAASKLIDETQTGVNCEKNVERIKSTIMELITEGKVSNFTPRASAILKYTRKELSLKYLFLLKKTMDV